MPQSSDPVDRNANDNVTLQEEGLYEPTPHRRYRLSTGRTFTGNEEHEIKRKKSNRLVRVPEDTFEQWAWDRLTRRALVILNHHRYRASRTDGRTGEVHEDAWTTIDDQDLAQRLLEVMWTEASDRIDNEHDGFNRRHPNTITISHLEDMVERIATHQRAVWDWQSLSDRGRKGGAESKRPQQITAAMVLGFPLADHTTPESKRIIAGALKLKRKPITVRTVEKRLAEFRDDPSVICPIKKPKAGFSKTSAYRSRSHTPKDLLWVGPRTDPSRYRYQDAYRAQLEVKRKGYEPAFHSRGDWLMALPAGERPATTQPRHPVARNSHEFDYLLEPA